MKPMGHYFVNGQEFAELTASPNGYAIRSGTIGSEGEVESKHFDSLENAKNFYKLEVGMLEGKGFRRRSGKPPQLTVRPPPKAKLHTKGLIFEDGTRFFEIVATPASLTIRSGALGTEGTTVKQKFASASESYEAYKQAIRQLPGYRLGGGDVPYPLIAAAKRESERAAKAPPKKSVPPARTARESKLEASIEADPDSADAYLVYADWLQTQKDPRGELIVLQHANKAAAKRLLDTHAEAFFGTLANLRELLVPAKGHVLLGMPTTWRWGYLQAVFLGNQEDFDDILIDDVLADLLDHPSARFLRELTLGINTFADNTYAGAAKVIGKRRLPTLRKLVIGDFVSEEMELNWTDMGNIEPLYKAVPNLESLTLRSGTMKLGKLVLPKLRELRILTGGLDKKSLAAITGQKWPYLEILNIQLGDENAPGIKLADLSPIFAGTHFPKLTHLGLGNCDFEDAIAAELARSKIAARIEHLDLSEGTLGDEGALALATGKWPRLKSIDVHASWLTKQGIAALKSIAKHVELGTKDSGQQDDDGDPTSRYVSGNE